MKDSKISTEDMQELIAAIDKLSTTISQLNNFKRESSFENSLREVIQEESDRIERDRYLEMIAYRDAQRIRELRKNGSLSVSSPLWANQLYF